MVKSYMWKEIEDVIASSLVKTKHILTFGTIGSKNVENDIDCLIMKKKNSSTKNFYKEIHSIFDTVNNYLEKKYEARAICFPHSGSQHEILHCANYKGDDLAFHVLIYNSLDQLTKAWTSDLCEDESIRDILETHYQCMVGKTEDLFNAVLFEEQYYYSNLCSFLWQYNRCNSHFDDELLMETSKGHMDYIVRKRLQEQPLEINSAQDVRAAFYHACDMIDKHEELKGNV